MRSIESWGRKLRRLNEIGDLGLAADAAPRETMRRIRLITLATLAMCGIGVASAAQFLRLEMFALSGWIATMVALGLANLRLLRVTKNPFICGHASLVILTSAIALTSSAAGGFHNPSFSWFYTVPLCAVVVVGLGGSAAWALITVGLICSFWMLPSFGVELVNQIPVEARESNALFTRVLAVFAMWGLGMSFVMAERRAEQELARANERRRREAAYTELVMHAAVSANEAPSFEAAMRESIERICKALGWFGGHIGLVSEDGTTTSSGHFYLENPERHEALRRISEQQVSPIGQGIAGRAVLNRRPEHVSRIGDANPGERGRVAESLGLRSALAVPIAANGEILAVLEFVAAEDVPDADKLVEVFTHIGKQLGRVAEREALHDRIRQSQKMEAVGQLAAGIAHEINNPMSYVRSNLHTLRKEWSALDADSLGDGDGDSNRRSTLAECRELIDESLQGVERTIAIVRDMKDFSHSGGADANERQVVDLSQLLDAALRVVTPNAPPGVVFEQDYTPDSCTRCSPNQITQVLVNILVNAIQAVGRTGTIHLSSGCEGNDAFVRIRDDGPGMDQATQERLFDPFFTTKPVGEGTGLGLSVSYEIIRNHEGEIRVQSASGMGATFEIRLPAASPASI